ncbi:MAG: ComEC/Rec2 family competence protein, partial [Chloroflexota bacterium]|nr:ComEC/Rec2 family competence protein [Chloroflexota bacterium]
MQEKRITVPAFWLLIIVSGAELAGILLGNWLLLPPLILCSAMIPLALALLLFWRDQWARTLLLAILFLIIGAWRYSLASPLNDPRAISKFISHQSIQLRGTVADEPKLQGRIRLLLIDVSSIRAKNTNTWQDAHGQIEVQTLPIGGIDDPYGANYTDEVELQGILAAALFHHAPHVQASMAFPRISVLSSDNNSLITALYHLRVTLSNMISRSLPQPDAALFIAILLSLRTPSLKPLILVFQETGTAHLIAPSGFKVTLLAGLIGDPLNWLYERNNAKRGKLLPAQKRKLERSRWLSTIPVVSSIVVYTLLSGAGPAALRAGIMGTLFVIAPRLGRIYNVYTGLALTALLLSLWDPFVVWDVGFQLSFLGTLGIVLFTPFFQRLLAPLARIPLGAVLVEITAVTLAAQTATLPIIALTFNQISFIAPVTNVLTVPLLATLICMGLLFSCIGSIYAPLAVFGGWIIRPFIWYMINSVTWCAHVPFAYKDGNTFTVGLAWLYYAVLALLASLVLLKRSHYQTTDAYTHQAVTPTARRIWRIIQCTAAIVILLATATTAQASQPDGQVHITFFAVEPTGQPAQGEAIFITTPDGKTILIDGGLDAVSLGQALDSSLPFWKRSLDFVILTSPKTDHLTGLQDIVNRYTIGEVLDVGMLHPNTGYALWRRTINDRHIAYTQIHQGASMALGSQMLLQVFWPPSPLAAGSHQETQNALIIRLVTARLSVLLLGSAATNSHALEGVMTAIQPNALSADIVQIEGEVGKDMPGQLNSLLQLIHPSLVMVTPAALSPKQRKQGITSTVMPPTSTLYTLAHWQVVQIAEVGTVSVTTSNNGWNLHGDGS